MGGGAGEGGRRVKMFHVKQFKENHNGIALVFGNEVNGVAQEVIDACDGCIELEQHGTGLL